MYYLGKIEIPAGTARNNADTAAPFAISHYPVLILQPNSDGLCVELGTHEDWNTDADRGMFVPSSGIDFRIATGSIPGQCVSIFNTTDQDAVVKVWGGLHP